MGSRENTLLPPKVMRILRPPKRAWSLYQLRLLLREAVKGSQAPNQFPAINWDDLATREGLLHHRDGPLVMGIRIIRKQHDLVRDIEIRIARGQPDSVPHDLARHRQHLHHEWLPIFR